MDGNQIDHKENIIDKKMETLQIQMCDLYGVTPMSCPSNMKLGIAANVRLGLQPINGMRVLPTGDTTGWYIWAGEEMSKEDDFFLPLHVEHLIDWCPDVIPYLLLPVGGRFQIVSGHDDVWFDKELG